MLSDHARGNGRQSRGRAVHEDLTEPRSQALRQRAFTLGFRFPHGTDLDTLSSPFPECSWKSKHCSRELSPGMGIEA